MRMQPGDPYADLVEAWQSGQMMMEAFEAFAHHLFNWICSQRPELHQGEQAQDLAAKVIRLVDRKIHTFRGEAMFFTWVVEFAKNVLRDHAQKRPAEIPLPQLELPEQLAPDNPEQETLRQMEREDALAQSGLSDQERQVFTLRMDERLSFKEIGDQLQISANAAQISGMKAMKKIAVYLQAQGWR